MECQRLQPQLRRHQPPRLAPRHRQNLPDPAPLLRPGNHRHLHLPNKHLQRPGQNRRHQRRIPGRKTTPAIPPSHALTVIVSMHNGKSAPRSSGDTVDLVNGEKTILNATGPLADARLLEPRRPLPLRCLHHPHRRRTKSSTSAKITTGFRKTEFRGGAGTGGVYINDKFVYLKGYAQRTSDEWAGLGQAYPDWMHDFTAQLIRDSHANYIRWMHISPQQVDVDAFDRFGIVQVCPAGDKERDVQGRQWDQRLEVMRDSMIYFRNNPSILFWEAGNNSVSADAHEADGRSAQANATPTAAASWAAARSTTRPHTPSRRILRRHDRPGPPHRRPEKPHRHVPRLQRRAPRPRPAHRNRRLPRRSRPPLLGRLLPAALRLQERPERHLQLELRNLRPRRGRAATGPTGPTASPTPTPPIPNGPATPRSTSPTPMPMAARIPAKSAASAAKSTPSASPRKSTSPTASCRTPARHPHPRPLDLPRRHQKNHLCHRPTATPWNSSSTANPSANHSSHRWLRLRLPRRRHSHPAPSKPSAKSRRQAGVRTPNSTPPAPPTAIKLTAITGPSGLQADGADVALFDVEVVDANGQRCPTDEARIDFTTHRPRHLARRLQQRQNRLHQQPLPQHRMRHQPRRHPLHPYPRHHHPHRHT